MNMLGTFGLAVLIMMFITTTHNLLNPKPNDSVGWLWLTAVTSLWFIINCPIFPWSVFGG